MKKILILTNIVLLLICVWQNWRIDDADRFTEFAKRDAEFYHEKYIHLKIHGYEY